MLSCNIWEEEQKSKSLEKLSAIVKKGFERYANFRSLTQINADEMYFPDSKTQEM